jgi:hypothetical protein
MDLPDHDPECLERTLAQMAWINRLLTGARPLLARTVLTTSAAGRGPAPCWTWRAARG